MTQHIRFGLLLLTASAFVLQGADRMDVRWQDMCTATEHNTLTITTSEGKVVEGYCANVTGNELTVRIRNHQIVKIARGTLGKVLMREGRTGHELRSLRHDLNGAIKAEVDGLLTEAGPFALVAIPPTLAWGIVATPFCALGDLKHRFERVREIRVI